MIRLNHERYTIIRPVMGGLHLLRTTWKIIPVFYPFRNSIEQILTKYESAAYKRCKSILPINRSEIVNREFTVAAKYTNN